MKVVEYMSYASIPIMICGILIYALHKKEKIYENFIVGAGEGLKVVVDILPTMIAIMIAINVFKESGAMEMLIKMISPVTKVLGVPSEIVPLGIMRSISGGASIGLLTDALNTYGPDSFLGKVASTIMASSETTLYVIAIYTASVGVKNTKHVLYIALLADLVAVIASIIVWRILS